MSTQEVLNKVYVHGVTQGRPCLNVYNMIALRCKHPIHGDLACPIGHLITDELYRNYPKTYGYLGMPKAVRRYLHSLAPELSAAEAREFFRSIMYAHDMAIDACFEYVTDSDDPNFNKLWTEAFTDYINKIADKFSLEHPQDSDQHASSKAGKEG